MMNPSTMLAILLVWFVTPILCSCSADSDGGVAPSDQDEEPSTQQELEAESDTDSDVEPEIEDDGLQEEEEEEETVWPDAQPTPGFAVIPKGEFLMGAPADQPGDGHDAIPHIVRLTHNFEIMPYEITQSLWREVAEREGWEKSPGHYINCGGDCPVERVNWFEALAFANAMSREAGLEECYTLENCQGTIGGGCLEGIPDCTGDYACDASLNGVSTPYGCTGYRLPTESEWEYAARSGTTTGFYNGEILVTDLYLCYEEDANLTQIAWYCANSDDSIAPVGRKIPNDWSLFDMLGNVTEWTWDWYSFVYPAGDETDPLIDPAGPSKSPRHSRVYRGGSFGDDALHLLCSKRDYLPPETRSARLGFRLVRSLGIGEIDPYVAELEVEDETGGEGDRDEFDFDTDEEVSDGDVEDEFEWADIELEDDWERPETVQGSPWPWCLGATRAVTGDDWSGRLTIPESTLYCGLFDETRSLEEEFADKAQLAIANGEYTLPTENGIYPFLLPFCIRFRDDGAQPKIHESGTLQASHNEQLYRFFISQPLETGNGDTWELRMTLIQSRSGEPEFSLDGSHCGLDCPFTSSITLCRDNCSSMEDRRRFDSCTFDSMLPQTHRVTFEGGEITLVLRIGYSLSSTEPGLFSYAEGILDDLSFTQSDYWKLIYNPEHHHFMRDFMVLFDTPIQGACGLEVRNLDPFLQEPFGTLSTMDCDLQTIEERTIQDERLEGSYK